MAVTNKGERKRLNFGAILDKITQHGKTIPELAAANNFSEEEFIKELELGLGPQNFTKAIKANSRNLKNQDRKKGNNRKTTTGKAYRPVVKATLNNGNTKGDDDMAKKTGNGSGNTKLTVAALRANLEGKTAQRDGAKALMDSAEAILLAKQSAQEAAKRALEDAKRNLDTADADVQNASKDFEKKKKDYTKVEDEVQALTLQLQEMERKIYLIAPNFKGKLPESGKFISSVKILGVEVAIETGDMLLEAATLDNMMTCGYKNLDEYFEALEFAKLCIAYATGKGEATILVDDSKLRKVLETQGIEI